MYGGVMGREERAAYVRRQNLENLILKAEGLDRIALMREWREINKRWGFPNNYHY